jgi:hypothetical protein
MRSHRLFPVSSSSPHHPAYAVTVYQLLVVVLCSARSPRKPLHEQQEQKGTPYPCLSSEQSVSSSAVTHRGPVFVCVQIVLPVWNDLVGVLTAIKAAAAARKKDKKGASVVKAKNITITDPHFMDGNTFFFTRAYNTRPVVCLPRYLSCCSLTSYNSSGVSH